MTNETSPFCPDCGGTGLNDWEQECSQCEGTGAPETPLMIDGVPLTEGEVVLFPDNTSQSFSLSDSGIAGDLLFKAGEGPDGNGNIIFEGPIKIDDKEETLQETLQRQEGDIAFLKGMLMKLVDG